MNTKCNIIKDLLPLYAENLCSAESRQMVAEHIAQCSECCNELKQISTEVVLQADADISLIKRIKKRTRIQKIVIAAVSVLAALLLGWLGQFYLINTDCTMDYEKNNLKENVWVEEDETGKLWMCRKGVACSADIILPTVMDANGNMLFWDDNFDKNQKEGYGFTLRQRKVDALAILDMGITEDRTLIEGYDSTSINYVFYYDDRTDTRYTLWEKQD